MNSIIAHVARAIRVRDSLDEFALARAAIEAMRYLVKMTPDGNQADDIILNKYIDKALKE